MYLAPAAHTPSPLSWWQPFILGWYLPASFALIWLSGPLWRGKKSTNEWLYAVSNRQISISGRYDLLHQLFFAGLFIYLGYLLLYRPQKHLLLVGLTATSMIGGYLAHKALIGSPLRVGRIIWELDFDELGAYNVRFGYVLSSSMVSCIVVTFQRYLYPALASHWLNMTLTWFRVLVSCMALYSIYAGSYCPCLIAMAS